MHYSRACVRHNVKHVPQLVWPVPGGAFRVHHFAPEHPNATAPPLATRRILMLLPRLERDRSGVQSLATAARIPA